MPDFLRMVGTLQERMQADLSRSDVLRVLIWPLAMASFGLLGAVHLNAHPWVLLFFATIIGVVLLVYLGSFIFLLVKDRDALRSEKYSLQKLAIENGLFGDSESGIIEVSTKDTLPAQPKGKMKKIGSGSV